jgi:hypothetical protein
MLDLGGYLGRLENTETNLREYFLRPRGTKKNGPRFGLAKESFLAIQRALAVALGAH